MRQYPWLPPDEFQDNGQTAERVVKAVENLVVIRDEQEMTMKELDEFLGTHNFHGFPVVRGERLLGYVGRDELKGYLGMFSGFPYDSMAHGMSLCRIPHIRRRSTQMHVLERRGSCRLGLHQPLITSRRSCPSNAEGSTFATRRQYVPKDGEFLSLP